MNKMGSRIKQKRLEKGLTCEALGKMLNVQKSAISKWERGAVENISQTRIKEMSDIFQCSPSWLMGYGEEESEEKKPIVFEYEAAEIEKALDLYRKYIKAIPQVQEAVEALLKTRRPDS